MTVSFFALYRRPEDADAFDSNDFGTHVPIIAGTPGLLENKVHRVKRQLVGEPAYDFDRRVDHRQTWVSFGENARFADDQQLS